MTDRELISVARGFRSGLIGSASSRLMCAIVSYPLQGLLCAYGQETDLMISRREGERNHVFLRLPDGRVLDPTADQFNSSRTKFPKIYLGKPQAIHRKAVLYER